MPESALSGELREAVDELQAYLSDQLPPLLVLDSARLLLAHSAELGAEVVRAWVNGQQRAPGSNVTTVDFLFHAVKKLQLLARLKLVDPQALQTYLDGVIAILIAQAPAVEQEALRTFLLQASEAESSLPTQLQVLYRPPTGAAPGASAAASPSTQLPPEVATNLRHFSLLLSRLDAASTRVGGSDEARRAALSEQAPQLLAAAAQSATTQGELEQHLQSLSRVGLMNSVRLSELFTTLSQGLPNWAVAEAPAHDSAPVQAMQRIVDLAADPARAAGYFRELLATIAKQFNDRSLPRAVQVLEVARRVLAEGKVEKTSADLMLGTAHEELDGAQLMAQTQHAANLPLLRRLLNFYPALTPEGLLRLLDNEPDRAKRRLWLALLEAHGLPARQHALDRLEASFADAGNSAHIAWLQRNFVYLLHRIHPAAGEDPLREVRLVGRCTEMGLPAPLVREGLIDLGLRHHPEAEAVLRARLEQIEKLLDQPGGAPPDAPELLRMLALIISGLARQGTTSARRTVVEHGLKQRPALGDTLERLGELSAYDLAADPETVDKLLAVLRAQLPMRVLGLSIRRHEVGPHHLVRALTSTRSEPVRAAFDDVARRFPTELFGQAAAAALANWHKVPAPPPDPEVSAPPPVAPAPAAGLAGDLEVFGLPELLQTLSQAESSGRLLLRDRAGRVAAELLLRKGEVREARVKKLGLPDAFYQLLETPQPGTFEFNRVPVEALPEGDTYNVMGLLMEGMRRYDELQRARVLAPDHAFLRATGNRPSPPPEETDGGFIRDLWRQVKDGGTPSQCEEAIAADAYRIRGLLAHWLAEGSLAAVEAPTAAAP
ncbi:MAG TPA: DUF4388 domain-containing protein [Thermoanaerobaculia bacterium]|jgi:hypothetical protein|nr:DUF4388 domain-containing protein [Thermoanaerobaculia bacterium]